METTQPASQRLRPEVEEAPTVPSPVPAAPRESYEFDAEQNRTMSLLGNNMTWVGIFLIIMGVVVALIGVRQMIHGRPGAPILLIQGALNVVIGFWTRGAAVQFSQVAATSGADIQHLMAALGELRRIYHLQKVLILAALVLMAAAVIVAVLASPVR